MKGYGGKILYIDLSSGRVKKQEVDDEFARKYVGGNGFGIRLLYDNNPRAVEPLDPRNCLILAPGSFCGSSVPQATKTGIYTKSPQTAALGESMFGSGIGPELKFAGYDALVVKGRAQRLSYILVENDKVEIKDATRIAGQSTHKAIKSIEGEIGRDCLSIASIGPAGENLVKFACIESDYRQAGRTGVGAVMGSKNVKAIAVRGTRGLQLADHDLIKELIDRWHKYITKHPVALGCIRFGTGEDLPTLNELHGVFPTRNWKDSVFEDFEELAPQSWVPEYSIRNEACYGCIQPCGKVFSIEEGKYSGTITDGPEFEAQFSLGSLLGNSNIELLARANQLCDELGLDIISTGGVIGWAMECYERGLISDDDLGGISLEFGSNEAILEVIEMIAKRRRIGDVLAEGVKGASKRLGKGSEEFAVHVKGLEPPGYDVRGMKGLALAFAVSTRGACHLRTCAYAPELGGSWWKFKNVDRMSTENRGFVKVMEDVMTVYDTIGICKFTRSYYFIEDLTEFFKAIHGYGPTVRELIKLGERIYNLEKAFNIREGLSRKDDSLPPRITGEPIRNGPSKGELVTPEELDQMLDEYYSLRGWDKNGIPTSEKLEDLGLEDISKDMDLLKEK